MGSLTQRQWIAIALVVVALICFVIFATSVNFAATAGNRRALISVAIGGTSATIAAWLWAGRRAAS